MAQDVEMMASPPSVESRTRSATAERMRRHENADETDCGV